MTAFVTVQFCFDRLPARIPYGISVLDIYIFSIGVRRDVIVTITGEAEQSGVTTESVSAAGVGNKGEDLTVYACIMYGELSQTYEIPVHVMPPKYTDKEILEKKIIEGATI